VAAPRIVGGFSPYETRGYKLLSVFVHAVPHHALHYVPREYLRLLEPIGIRTHDTTKRLIYTPQAHKKIELFFKEHKIVPHRDTIVGILPAVGGDPIKRWLPERFAAVGDHLAKKWGARILILGTGRDEADVTAMVRWSARETRAVNTLNMFSLDEYKALIASLSLFISADTGPVYIAEAFEIPSIDIVGPMYEDIQPPRGELHRTVAAARAKPALGILDNTVYDYREARRQAEAITVDMVNGVANELLEKIQSKKEREVREKSGDTIVDHHPPPAW
jgi:ADP-heptose:LPS heptosyltransferase